MSEENLHKQKFRVEQWPTSKVTLYPTRASIVRVIEDVKLKAGLNEITISDLTSLADQDSIRVSGSTNGHPARINDLTIDHANNPDFGPSTSDDSDLDSESEEEEEPEALKTLQKGVDEIGHKIGETDEKRASARKELALLEQYVCTLAGSSAAAGTTTDPETMKKTLELYSTQRAVQYATVTACDMQLLELRGKHVKLNKALDKARKAFEKSLRAKKVEQRKKLAEKQARRKEKQEQRPEKTVRVLRVRITIEVPTSDIPAATSKRSEVQEDFLEAQLTLTYTTSSASWTPMYDLRLDTTNPSLSTLTYRAHFTNRTYETWTQALITLSTSQASFGGLSEKVPQMESWRVTAGRKWDTVDAANGENGLYSLAEVKLKEALQPPVKRPTWNTGGVEAQAFRKSLRMRSIAAPTAPLAQMAPAPTAVYSSMRMSGGNSRAIASEASESEADEVEEADGATLAPAAQAMQHSLAGADTYGFTTTYDLPTARTIPSSPLVRRHVIAEVPLPSLSFTYIVIPKLKPAAFLKARVTNTSHIPLLPGQAGLTLDGSFMGNLTFPRCAPAETVVLALGVDQGVKVEYERPRVKHAVQGGMLTGKEEVGAFTRTMQLTNTKAAAVSLVVLDQVPVPEDERLKVNITYPRGLRNLDDAVKSGVGLEGKAAKPVMPELVAGPPPPPPKGKLEDIAESSSVKTKSSSFSFGKSSMGKTPALQALSQAPPAPSASSSPLSPSGSSSGRQPVGTWGSAKATLKKNGEVRWDVDLNKGGCVSLALEWECRIPSGEGVQALS